MKLHGQSALQKVTVPEKGEYVTLELVGISMRYWIGPTDNRLQGQGRPIAD
jgi:hypothetical protein